MQNKLCIFCNCSVVVKEISPCGTYAQIHMVDSGVMTIIKCNECLYALDELSDIATQYPHQAVRVRLADVPTPLSADFAKQLGALLPLNGEPAPLRVSGRRDGVPEVEVFTRTEKEEYLFSVNRAIAMRNQHR